MTNAEICSKLNIICHRLKNLHHRMKILKKLVNQA